MRDLTPSLAAHLDGELTSLATCWKLTRRDGTVLGFTDHDGELMVEGVTYRADTGFHSSAITMRDDMAASQIDLEGMLSADALVEAELMGGAYDHAEIEIFQVNHHSPGDGSILLQRGWLGEVTLEDGRFTAELRGLSSLLGNPVGQVYSPGCRAMFGDARCGIDAAAHRVTGTLTSADGALLVDTARGEADGAFAFGQLTMLDGANAGLTREVKFFQNGRFTLTAAFPYLVQPGEAYAAVQGCDKQFATCRSRYQNAVNFRGEPHVPGIDRLIETSATRRRS